MQPKPIPIQSLDNQNQAIQRLLVSNILSSNKFQKVDWQIPTNKAHKWPLNNTNGGLTNTHQKGPKIGHSIIQTTLCYKKWGPNFGQKGAEAKS